MIDSDYITELDVVDPEIAGMFDMVECVECDDADEKMNMHEQYFGGFLCGPCHYAAVREYHDDLASMMGAGR